MPQKFDTVILGFDEQSQDTVKALQQQGKRVLYIPIDPQTMITIMDQKQVHTPVTDNTIDHLEMQQNHMHTITQNTTTYILQPVVQAEEPVKEEQEVTFSFVDVESTKEKEPVEKIEKPFDTESVYSNVGPMVTPLTQESYLINDSILGIHDSKKQELPQNKKKGSSVSMLGSNNLFNPVRIEGEEQPPEIWQHSLVTDEEKVEQEPTQEFELELELNPDPELDPELNPDPELDPELNPDPELDPELNPDPELDPNLKLDPELDPNLKLDPDLELEPKLPESIDTVDEKVVETKEEPKPKQHGFIFRPEEYKAKTIQHGFIFHPEAVEPEPKKTPQYDFIYHGPPEDSEEAELEEQEPQVMKQPEFDEVPLKETHSFMQKEKLKNLLNPDKQEQQVSLEENDSNAPKIILDRDIRQRKKVTFQASQLQAKMTPVTEFTKKEKTTEQVEELTKKTDMLPLEPFSPRRRNKKNRPLSSATIPNPIVPNNTTPPKQEQSFSTLIQGSIVQRDLEPEPQISKPAQQPSAVEEPEIEEANNDIMNIDNIEFEEPLGYSSFEDFFPSFSNTTDRKRQEMDKIEKRKIALRGLHNLINNLG